MSKILSDEEKKAQKKVRAGALLGAAFLTATSAVGPGFLTQTAVFTEELKADFAFVIVGIILIHLGTQLNVWRIMSVSGLRAQELADKVFPGLGAFVSILIALGGLAFNIGNLAGAGMGFNVLFGIDVRIGVVVSALIGCGIFLSKEMGKALDKFTKILGGAILLLIMYVAVTTQPPVGEALLRTVAPTQIPLFPIITLIGGTVGGYIVFAGGNRLLDAGLVGKENVADVTKSAVRSVVIASLVRVFLFLAVLGVVAAGFQLDPSNPPASAFQLGAGNIGYMMFGIVLWSAGITSAVGASYTSVAFLTSLHDVIARNRPYWIIGFIVASTLIFVTIGEPVTLLILAGSLNGLILPVTLGSVLLAARRKDVVGNYEHPKWMFVFGTIIVLISIYAGINSLTGIADLF